MFSPSCAPAQQVAAEGNGELSLGRVLRHWLAREDALGAAGSRLPLHHWKVLRALAACRTPELGAHHYRCRHCGADHVVPHSCRDRHCPGCQPMLGYDWMEKQKAALLPVPYFHLVFTLPHELNPLIAQNQALLYMLLFDAASATLLEFGRNHFGARIGVTAVLHTWSQTLSDHYHLHCIVTGGGLRLDGKGWARSSPHWIFPVKALAKVFRGKYRHGLEQLHAAGKLQFHGQLQGFAKPGAFGGLVARACQQPWVVYAKRPFAGPEQVLGYLARYTHRVGITNRRLKRFDPEAGTLTFAYKDYADRNRPKQMTLSLEEFVRRFRLHILPPRFVKIRHYGLLSNRTRKASVAAAREALGVPATEEPEPDPPTRPASPSCPRCGSTELQLVRILLPAWRTARAPPRLPA